MWLCGSICTSTSVHGIIRCPRIKLETSAKAEYTLNIWTIFPVPGISFQRDFFLSRNTRPQLKQHKCEDGKYNVYTFWCAAFSFVYLYCIYVFDLSLYIYYMYDIFIYVIYFLAMPWEKNTILLMSWWVFCLGKKILALMAKIPQMPEYHGKMR